MKIIKSLSVILPVYNGEPFLEEAVQSILKQSWLPEQIEILIIDDASIDKSLEVAHKLEKLSNMIKVINSEKNQGIARTRNLGIQLSQYEHLAFIDADDTWSFNKLELQQSAIKEYPDLDYILGRQTFHLYKVDKPPPWLNPLWLEESQAGWVLGTTIIEKSTLLKVGLFDEQYLAGIDDTDWFSKAHEKKLTSHMLNDAILQRKIHQSNTTTQNTLPANVELLKLIKLKLDRLNA